MPVVYKYELPLPRRIGPFSLDLPRGARVLSAAVQHGVPVMWALVDHEAPTEERQFLLAPTGAPFHPNSPNSPEPVFVGTLLLAGGEYVLHLFDITPDAPL